MPWITENEKTYWMPDVLPLPTEEHQSAQSEKLYLTHEGRERRHPGWTYAETNAFVDDEYLFQNEGWKLIIDEIPSVVYDLKTTNRNDLSLWEEVDERTLRVTYSYVDFTDEQIAEYTIEKWEDLRKKRDRLLLESDVFVLRSYENNIEIPQEVLSYRTQLRDFPSTINNILEFNIGDDTLWPTKPTLNFEV